MVEGNISIHRYISREARKILLLSQILLMLFLSACEISNVHAMPGSKQTSNSAADFAEIFDKRSHRIGEKITVLKNCIARVVIGGKIFSAPDMRTNEYLMDFFDQEFDIFNPILVRFEPTKTDFLAFTSREKGDGITVYTPKKSSFLRLLPTSEDGCRETPATIVRLPRPVEYGTEGLIIAKFQDGSGITTGIGRGGRVAR